MGVRRPSTLKYFVYALPRLHALSSLYLVRLSQHQNTGTDVTHYPKPRKVRKTTACPSSIHGNSEGIPFNPTQQPRNRQLHSLVPSRSSCAETGRQLGLQIQRQLRSQSKSNMGLYSLPHHYLRPRQKENGKRSAPQYTRCRGSARTGSKLLSSITNATPLQIEIVQKGRASEIRSTSSVRILKNGS